MKKITVDVTRLFEYLREVYPRVKLTIIEAAIREYMNEKAGYWQTDTQGTTPEGIPRIDMIIKYMGYKDILTTKPGYRVRVAFKSIEERGERLTLETLGRELGLGHDADKKARQVSIRAQKAYDYLVRHGLKEMFDEEVTTFRNSKRRKR